MTTTLAVEPDTRPEVGAGHVSRCLSLAIAWRATGGRVIAPLDRLSPLWRERYTDAGVEPHDGGRPDWTVADDYRLGTERQHALRATTLHLAVIDDHGSLAPYDADLVIDQNVGADTPGGVPSATGTRFVLLRPEFGAVRAGGDREHPERARRVLVSVGGAPTDHTRDLVAAVSAELTASGLEVDLLEGATDVADRMAAADLALAASGTSAYELACVGTPAVLLAVAANQEPVGERLAAHGAARYLGRSVDITAGNTAAAVLDLAADRAARESIAAVGRSLVDGRGARRVVARLRSFDLRLRDVDEGDARLLWEWANDPVLREYSFSPAPITWEEHLEWFQKRLVSESSHLFMAVDDTGPVGQIRFDRDGSAFVIDYSVAASRRGHGLGAVLLLAGAAEMRRRSPGSELVGVVRPGNAASIASFDIAGFREAGVGRFVTGGADGG